MWAGAESSFRLQIRIPQEISRRCCVHHLGLFNILCKTDHSSKIKPFFDNC